MLEFGTATWVIGESTLLSALGHIREFGFSVAEVWMEHVWQSGESPEQIRDCAETLGLGLTVHAASYDVNVTSLNPGIRCESRRQIADSIHMAASLGARCVVVHPGRLTRSRHDTEDYWRSLVEFLQSMDSLAADYGIRLGIEVMEQKGGHVFVTPCAIRRLMDRPWQMLGVTVDLAHVATLMDHREYLSQLEPGWIVHVHASDTSRVKSHLPLGTGDMDVNAALAALEECYSGVVILEGIAPDRGREVLRNNRDFLSTHGWLPPGDSTQQHMAH